MNKENYISALKKKLLFRISEEEINDILADISDCFDAGKNEGKSDTA